jgi:hypothetical protein
MIAEFQTATDCQESQARRSIQRFLLVLSAQLERYHYLHEDDDYYIKQSELLDRCGSIRVNGERIYVVNVIRNEIRHGIFITVNTGNNINKKLSRIRLTVDFEELLLKSGTAEEYAREVYRGIIQDDSEIDWVDIDVNSVQAYLRSHDQYQHAEHKKIQRYRREAQTILKLAQAFEGCMPHVISESRFGRKYYTGPNLQTTSSHVRAIALGDCHQYDLEASVFAWKLSTFRQIADNFGDGYVARPATLEYLEHKAALRKKWARDVFGRDDEGYVKIIKRAIAAMGFGARLSRSPKTDLSDIITSQAARDRFCSHPDIQRFSQEQEEINAIIVEFGRATGQYDSWMANPDLVTENNRLDIKKTMSFLYQHRERDIIEGIQDIVGRDNVLLTVHDCIYTRRPIPLRDVREYLREQGEYYGIDHEQHRAWHWDGELQEHQARMAQEQELAEEIFGRTFMPEKHSADAHAHYRPISDDRIYDGSGWDGSSQYDADFDPLLDDLSAEERREYQQARNRVLGDQR